MIDQPITLALLFLLGIFTGAVAGVLGIGGGLLLVPALTLWQVSLVQATATSLVGVLLSAVSGSLQNWRNNKLNWQAALALALFGVPTAQLGAWIGDRLPRPWLALSFAALMLVALYLMDLKRKLKNQHQQAGLEEAAPPSTLKPTPVISIGLLAGLLSGLFGVGGGTVMVPLQMLLLSEPIKAAVRTSLGAIVAIAASGLAQHAWNGNVLWIPGICLGLGGMVGAQAGTRLLPLLSDRLVDRSFRLLLLFLTGYMVWQATQG